MGTYFLIRKGVAGIDVDLGTPLHTSSPYPLLVPPSIIKFGMFRSLFHLQASVLEAWKGSDENEADAKAEFLKRAKANGKAALGEYKGDLASAAAGKSLFVANHAY